MKMKNPLKFFQEVKQEAFKVTWPTGKETLQGTLMVAAMAIFASLDQTNLLVSFNLKPAFPNPFNSDITIPFEIESYGNVILSIFSLLGEKVHKVFLTESQIKEGYVKWNLKNNFHKKN